MNVVQGCLPVEVQAKEEQQEPVEDCIVGCRIDVIHICNQLQRHKPSEPTSQNNERCSQLKLTHAQVLDEV